MFKVMKVIVVSLLLLMCFNLLNGQDIQNNTSKLKQISRSPLKNGIPIQAPKKVLLIDDFIKVNSRDTIFVQTIQFPLMTDAEKVFVGKKIADYRSSIIKKFIDSFYNRDRIDQEYTQNFSYSQNWKFDIIYQSQTEISLKLSNYEFTGGAHGNTSVKSFNLDLKNLKAYKLIEKFPNLDVEKVAEYCTNYCLKNNIPIFESKIKASPELFNIWNFTNEGLLLSFQQYSIAPYSSGIIEIHIPKKEVEKLKLNN